jgi:hypothetical protein
MDAAATQTEAALQYQRFVQRQPFANRSFLTADLQQHLAELAGRDLSIKLPEVTEGERDSGACKGVARLEYYQCCSCAATINMLGM